MRDIEDNNIVENSQFPAVTAAIRPELFDQRLVFSSGKRSAVAVMLVFIVIGFGLRLTGLGTESLGEDELNKLQTAAEYREKGLSAKNGEHPFLMKGLQTVSISIAERINGGSFNRQSMISEEAALRFPVALFGTMTIVLIFLLISMLFGRGVGIIAAGLWAVEPMAIGFDRVAKEDSLVLFFFLLTSLFWVKGQTAAEKGDAGWTKYAWLTGISFAALMASKYYPHLLAIPAAYYIIFQYVPATKWRMESMRWLKFVTIMGFAFLVFNPTIMLPETWREMLTFSSEKRIGHDSYEFMGEQYRNQMTAWLSGVPWTFYYVFIAVKTSLLTLILAVIGLPLLFRRRMGDGRFLLFFWAFMWFMPFTFLGGKFTRYFTLAEPLLLISAAVCACFLIVRVSSLIASPHARSLFQWAALVTVIAFPLYNSYASAPHYRLFTNVIGGGQKAAGSHFPHDEFYDADSREIIEYLALNSAPGAVTATETPGLFEHYAGRIGRSDLAFVNMSDPRETAKLKAGDLVVYARGRRYFSNRDLLRHLSEERQPVYRTVLGTVVSSDIFLVDAATVKWIAESGKVLSNRN